MTDRRARPVRPASTPMRAAADRDLWVVGDVHGALNKLRSLLLQAGLIDLEGRWAAEDSHLVFLGDYLDRGPDGARVVAFIRALELQAEDAGGRVTALLGNHEVMFLAAQRFRALDPHDGLGFREYWLRNGGLEADAERMDAADRAWLADRPAMVLAGPWLLMHADSSMYLRLGRSIREVNAQVTAMLRSADPDVWGDFANAFSDRFAFVRPDGVEIAARTLMVFGGQRLAHGHTPVYILREDFLPDANVGAPVPYAGGACLGLDSGMAYREEAGFVARLDAAGVAEVIGLNGKVEPAPAL